MPRSIAHLHEPMRRLDSRPRNGRRPSTAERIESNALRVAALVAARVVCECESHKQAEQAAAERLDDKRVEAILLRFQSKLDAEQREYDRRVAGIIRDFEYELDRQHRTAALVEKRALRSAERTAHRLAKRAAQEARRKAYLEYLGRCARRAAQARRSASLEYEAWPGGKRRSQPGPLVLVGPATQPGRLSREELAASRTPAEQPKPVRLRYSLSERISQALAKTGFEQLASGPEYTITDYTQPERDEGALSSLEECHMQREDLELYDEEQRVEIRNYDIGLSSINRPTYAVLAARALCSCPPDFGRPTTEELLQPSNVTILEGQASSRRATCTATLEAGTPVEGTSESRIVGTSRLPSQGGIVLF